MTFYSRAEWGARPPTSTPKRIDPSVRVGFKVHYTTGEELGRDDCAQWVREIQKFHQDGRGWSDVGYNLLVCRHGDVFEGRGWDVQGAHCEGRNVQDYGVVFMGDDDPGQDVPEVARVTLRALYDQACARSGKTLERSGHRDHAATACPGDELYEWVHAGMPLAVEPPPPPPPPGGPVTYSTSEPVGEGWVPVVKTWARKDGTQWAQLATDFPADPPPPPPPPPPVEPPVVDWPAFPGPQHFGAGQVNDYVLMLGQRLQALGFDRHYRVGPSRDWGEADRLNVVDYQIAHGWTGADADGYPGPGTWRKLGESSVGTGAPGDPTPPPVVPAPVAIAGTVYVSKLTPGQTDSDSVRIVQRALNATSLPGGATIAVTGNYDAATVAEAKKLQGVYGDPQDGDLGYRQAARLLTPWSAVTVKDDSAPPPQPPSTGTTIVVPGYKITYGYGNKHPRYADPWNTHFGDDWACPVGSRVQSTWTGTVVYVGSQGWGPSYGLQVHVKADADGKIRAYCHNSRAVVAVGQRVTPGQQIAVSGKTGMITGPHSHVEQRHAPYRYGHDAEKPTY